MINPSVIYFAEGFFFVLGRMPPPPHVGTALYASSACLTCVWQAASASIAFAGITPQLI
jgi:hypothetical protein